MPALAAVARIFHLVAWNEFFPVAHSESSLSFDGRDHERPVEFNLNPFFAKVGQAYWLERTPSAARYVQVEPVLFYVVLMLWF